MELVDEQPGPPMAAATTFDAPAAEFRRLPLLGIADIMVAEERSVYNQFTPVRYCRLMHISFGSDAYILRF
jgi:hypothetical protein